MKIFKNLLFAAILSLCAVLSVAAQSDDDKKTPPKGKPPVVVVKPREPEKPKDDKSKDKDGDKKSKKPQSAISGAMQLVDIIFD